MPAKRAWSVSIKSRKIKWERLPPKVHKSKWQWSFYIPFPVNSSCKYPSFVLRAVGFPSYLPAISCLLFNSIRYFIFLYANPVRFIRKFWQRHIRYTFAFSSKTVGQSGACGETIPFSSKSAVSVNIFKQLLKRLGVIHFHYKRKGSAKQIFAEPFPKRK